MQEKELLGTLGLLYRNGDKNFTIPSIKGTDIYLVKHELYVWQFYFGVCVNDYANFDFKEMFIDPKDYDVNSVFAKTKIHKLEWMNILDLMKQAYALRAAAEVYKRGGYIINNKDTMLIINRQMEDRINRDLAILLNKIWLILQTANKS